MKCQRCKRTITIKDQSTEIEGTLIDTDYEFGHKGNCRYFMVNPDGGREWADIIANSPTKLDFGTKEEQRKWRSKMYEIYG